MGLPGKKMNYYNYFTEIEEHFVKRRGKHLLISPMDWNLIAAWRDAGVPLHVALRGIDIAMDGHLARQTQGQSKVNSLCYCHDAVMEAFAGHLESRVGESCLDAADPATPSSLPQENGDGPDKEEIAGFVSEKIREISMLCEKQYQENVPEGLQRILARLHEIAQALQASNKTDMEALERDLAILDDLLVTELRSGISAEDMQAWEQEAKKELKVYKKRLPKETFEKIRENFYRDKVRRKFHIGELSLFRL